MYDVFSLPEIRFRPDFVWGSSTAAHQIEGDNIYSQFYQKELEGKIWAPGDVDEVSGKACNHYKMYREDVELISNLGHQVYRFSIEWSRIEPNEGSWNEEAIEHYIDLLEQLVIKGIKPMVTLHHFTHPMWFEEKGAFSERENIKYFLRFVQRIVPKIKDYVFAWNIFNEFNRGHYKGAPHKLCYLIAHAKAY
ncbi:MAG: family 1 glycosylhydrolase, partial [Verrucomicrobiota bacterium]